MKTRLILILFIVAAEIAVSTSMIDAEANDTYNFYFQKAPGPVTVNQGTASQTAGPANAPDAPAAVNTMVPPTTSQPATNESAAKLAAAEEIPTRKNFFLSLGYAINGGEQATRAENLSMRKPEYLNGQYAVKAEYEIGERFALTGEVYKLKNEVGLTHSQFFTENSVGNPVALSEADKKSIKNVIDWSLGAALNLVRLKATTLSLLGGLNTIPFVRYESSAPTKSSGYATPTSVDHQLNLYAGTRLRLIADNVWGIEISAKYLVTAKIGIAQAGLTFAL